MAEEKQIGLTPANDAASEADTKRVDVVPQEADQALAFVSREALFIDDATNKQILRKIDWHVLPWMCFMYFLQYLDKGTLNYAGVMGIKQDANLNADQFSWLGSIYYLGYLLAAFPHNRAMQYFNPAKYIGVFVFFWGVALASMAAAHNFQGLMAARSFLGVGEAVSSCGLIILTASWYRKYEHATRVGLWSSFIGVANITGGLIAYGCLAGYEASPNTYFTSWRILVLATGIVSSVFGLCMFFFLAASPIHARWLSQEEKVLAIERLRTNHQGVGSHQFKWSQVREAFTDVRTWLYVLFILSSQIPMGAVVLLSSSLISSLGFSSKETLLLAMPGGALQIISGALVGFVADRTKYRSLTAAAVQAISLFGIALLFGLGEVAPLHDRAGQLAAYIIIVGTGATAFFMVLSMISSNVLGTTKKTTTNGIAFTAMAVAYLVGPQIFRDGPYYRNAKIATTALWAVSVCVLVGLHFLNARENKNRDADPANNPNAQHEANIEFLDLTDKENKLMRYVL